jgi:hypothetical protein
MVFSLLSFDLMTIVLDPTEITVPAFPKALRKPLPPPDETKKPGLGSPKKRP